MADVSVPQFTDSVDLRYFVEPLGGPTHPRNYLDRFPDALYNKAPDSRFVKFMYAVLGPVGIGWLKANLLKARLQFEAHGISLFSLEDFYGDPFQFGRILSDYYTDDTSGLLPISQWDAIRSQDEAYRSRALQFMNAARLGTSPTGMQLAASSGIGQECEVVENYRYLFDLHSDDPLGLPYYGSQGDLGEFIIIPRAAISRSEVQLINFAQAQPSLGSNDFTLAYNGFAASFAYNATADALQSALDALPSVGAGNTQVSGGPAPLSFAVRFTGNLSNQSLPTIAASFIDPVSGSPVSIPVQVLTGVIDPAGEAITISPADKHSMQVAIDYLRPVASYPTFQPAASTIGYQPATAILASSQYTKVIRYVTGNPAVNWPTVDNTHWIEASVENEAPQLQDNLQAHYVGFHAAEAVWAYTDLALADPQYAVSTAVLAKYASVHVGAFPEMRGVMPFFAQFDNDTNTVFSPAHSDTMTGHALADHPELLTTTAQTDTGQAFINNIYPADSVNLQGRPEITYHPNHFWASVGRPSGAELLEIDLGSPQAVNFIALEVSAKPIDIEIAYDTLDQSPHRNFVAVTPRVGFPASVYFDASHTVQWRYFELSFDDGRDMIFTRFIRLTFIRRADTLNRFLFDPVTQIQLPWTIDVRNLRIGRIVGP